MDVTGPESDWRSTNFRQKLVSQIDEAMRKAGVAHNKSSKDMESHVFMKAKTRTLPRCKPLSWSSLIRNWMLLLPPNKPSFSEISFILVRVL
uniref:Mediator of RNA polymerase II transcription subunit 15 n=1 Tax=Apteryx owenii TaxID=8824 RepID=A0A8B9PWI9_APTOW